MVPPVTSDFAVALAMIATLPLTAEEKAGAVRRLMSEMVQERPAPMPASEPT